MKRIFSRTTALVVLSIIAAASATAAAPRVCLLKYDAAAPNMYYSGTPCSDAAAAYPDGGGKNLIKFDQGCGKDSYKVIAVYEQDSTVKHGIGGYELKMGYDAADFGGPASSSDCNSFLSQNLLKTCPGGSGASSFMELYSASFSTYYTTNNVNLFTVELNSMNYTPENHATATLTWQDPSSLNLYDENFDYITGFILQEADAYCEDPHLFVLPPTDVNIAEGIFSCYGEPMRCVENYIQIGYTPPTMCYDTATGASVLCPAGCNPGVTVKRTVSGYTSTLAAKTENILVTDTTPVDVGTPVTYTITGVCTGAGAADSLTGASITYTSTQNLPPAFNSVLIAGQDPNSGALSPPVPAGQPVRITGILDDPDSTVEQMHLRLLYATGDDFSVALSNQATGTIAPDRSFYVDIPGEIVHKGHYIFWSLEAYNEEDLSYYFPFFYDGTGWGAMTISSSEIYEPTSITDNQPGDDQWRAANTGVYNVDFSAPGGLYLDRFQVRACSTETNCGDIIDWTDVATDLSPATEYTADWSLPDSVWNAIPDGSVAYISAQAFDDIGVPASSGPLFYVEKDTTAPPAPATIDDGPANDAQYATSAGELSANWSAATDAQSGIASYWYSIGTSAGASDTLGWTGNGTSTFVTKTGMTLTNGTDYYFSVKAQNNAGLFSPVSSSDGQTYDIAPPAEVSALTANGDDTSATLTWSNPGDTDFSHIVLVRGNSRFPENPADGTAIYSGASATFYESGLTSGEQYYFKAFAYDRAGNNSPGAAPGSYTAFSPDPLTLILHQDWNIIGAPRQNAAISPLLLWGTSTYAVASVSAGVLSFATAQENLPLALSSGYWVYSPGEIGSVAVGGEDFTADTHNVSLGNGWNMFSIPFKTSLAWNSQHAALTCGGAPASLPSVYSFKNGQYTKIDPDLGFSLAPWKGYLIKTSGQCTLSLTK